MMTARYYNKNLFSKSLFERQSRLIEKFDSEVKTTMEQIKKKEKLKIKRKKSAIYQTTKMLMGQESSTFQQPIYPSGSPEQLVIRQNGLPQSFISTRMQILNKNFFRSITEIFYTDEEFSKTINEYKFRITDARVSADYNILQVYWFSENVDEQHLEMVAFYLNNNKGRLHELLADNLYTRTIPWIAFLYDLQANYQHEIETRLEKCRKDLEQSNVNQEEMDRIAESNFKFEDRINFNGNLNISVDYSEKGLEKLKYKQNSNCYNSSMPPDAKIFKLDYGSLYNKVLHNVHRTRAQHQQDLSDLKSLDQSFGVHSCKSNAPNNPIDYNTEARIKAMKKFILNNRKRKDKLELHMKRKILREEMDRFDNYERLREYIEERYLNMHEEGQTNDYFKEDDHQ